MLKINKELACKDLDEFIRKEVWGIDEDRVEGWLEASDQDVFAHNYVLNDLVYRRSLNPLFVPDYNYFNSISNYLKTWRKRHNLKNLKPIPFMGAYQEDVYFCLNALEKASLLAHHKKRIHHYLDYLHEHQSQFSVIDYLESEEKYPVLGVKDLCTSPIVSKLLENLDTENHLRLILDRMDLVQAYLLKDFYGFTKKYAEEERIHYLLEETIPIDIPLLTPYPNQKSEYLQAIKSWLNDALAERQKILNDYSIVYGSIPKFIRAIDEFLDQKINLPPTLTHQAVEVESSKMALPTDYPKHVFADAAAFALFDLLAKGCKKAVQIVFLFRHMSEIEKPPKIVSKYSPFRLWFEEYNNNLDIVLNEKPQTYVMAKTDDRLLAYKTAKALFQKLQNPTEE